MDEERFIAAQRFFARFCTLREPHNMEESDRHAAFWLFAAQYTICAAAGKLLHPLRDFMGLSIIYNVRDLLHCLILHSLTGESSLGTSSVVCTACSQNPLMAPPGDLRRHCNVAILTLRFAKDIFFAEAILRLPSPADA